MRYIPSDRAGFVLDAIVEDGVLIRRRRAVRVLTEALQVAYAAGEESGTVRTEINVARAAGLAHGLSTLKGRELLRCLQQLAAGGRVRLVVEGKVEEPARLRLVKGHS